MSVVNKFLSSWIIQVSNNKIKMDPGNRMYNFHIWFPNKWVYIAQCTCMNSTEANMFPYLPWSISCKVPQLSFTLALRRTGASSQNVGKISFFAIKLSTREQSATFHDHRSNWEFIWRISTSTSSTTLYYGSSTQKLVWDFEKELHYRLSLHVS